MNKILKTFPLSHSPTPMLFLLSNTPPNQKNRIAPHLIMYSRIVNWFIARVK